MTSLRSTDRRREADLGFLEALRTAGAVELLSMRRALAANGPEWQCVAVCRALERVAKEGLLHG